MRPIAMLPPPHVAPILNARIEADLVGTALLDATGVYRARLRPDLSNHAHTAASPGLRLRTPHASRNHGPPAGWHFVSVHSTPSCSSGAT